MALQDRFEKLNREYDDIQQPHTGIAEYDIAAEKLLQHEEYITENVEAVMLEKFEKAIVKKIDDTADWFELSVKEQKELLTSFVENLLTSEGILFLDQDFHLARVIDRVLKQESEFLDLDLFLYGEENKSVVYVYGSGDIYVETDDKTAKSDRVLDKTQVQKLKRNIFRMRGLSPDSTVKTLNFRYHDFLISTVAGENEFFIIKKARTITPNFSVLDALSSLKLNILFIGGINSGKSLCMESLLNFFGSKYLNNRSVLIQQSPFIKPLKENILSIETEFIQSKAEFVNIYDNILRLNPGCIFTDNIQEEFLPYLINGVHHGGNSLRITFRADSLTDCTERLSGMYAKEFNTSLDFAKRKIFSKFNLIVELNPHSQNQDIFKNFYLVNHGENGVTFDKLEVSAESLASILCRLSEKFGDD